MQPSGSRPLACGIYGLKIPPGRREIFWCKDSRFYWFDKSEADNRWRFDPVCINVHRPK